MSELEDRIHEFADRGELTHMSLTPYKGAWSASVSMASPPGGFAHGEAGNPVAALLAAFDNAKLRKKRVAPPVTVAVKEDDAADEWLPKP